MIEVKFSMDESRRMVYFRMDGHAQFDDFGKDLVCASATMLAYTLAQNVEMAKARGLMKNYKTTVKLKKGKANIICRATDDDAYAELLHIYCVIQTGYQLLAHNYPDNVVLLMFGEATEP